MATKGTTWLVRRSRDLVPALVALAVREWLTAEDEVTERELVPGFRAPLNLNGFRRPSGNLEHCGGLPLAGLKVRSRISRRNGKGRSRQAAARELRDETHEPDV